MSVAAGAVLVASTSAMAGAGAALLMLPILGLLALMILDSRRRIREYDRRIAKWERMRAKPRISEPFQAQYAHLLLLEDDR